MFIDQAQMGRITNMYAYVAFFLVVLTYGMETGFFRFAAKEKDTEKVFSTSFLSLGTTAILFLFFIIGWKENIAHAIDFSGRSIFVVIMGVTLFLDVISVIPFAKLRLDNRPKRFAFIKLVNIATNIFFNLFFLSLCPYLVQQFPDGLVANIYDVDFGIGYVFLSNLIASIVALILLIPQVKLSFNYDFELFRRMFRYSFPILIVGFTGMINMQIDKILLPKLLPESAEPMKQLGIYAASFKMAVILNMFIQAFRFAFEPFFFSRKNDSQDRSMYVIIMKYFTIFGLIIFLGFTTFIDLFKFLIGPEYRAGISIVPIVLLANLFMGIYFTLSLWYKLTDKTIYGAYMGIFGSVITLTLNFLFIPIIGYYASAWAILACFVSMTIISYILAKKYYPIPYDLRSFFFYFVTALVLFGIYWLVRTESNPAYWLSIILNIVFLSIIVLKEKRELLSIVRK